MKRPSVIQTLSRYKFILFLLVSLLLISYLGTLINNLPWAISLPQIIAIFLSSEVLWHLLKLRNKPIGVKSRAYWAALLVAVLAYINFLWFFSRSGVQAVGLSSASLVHSKASTLVVLIVILCLCALLFDENLKKPTATNKIVFKKGTFRAVWASIITIFFLIYTPQVQKVFDLSPLSTSDWLYALVSSIVLVAVVETQKHMSLHSRKAVHAIHPDLK